LSRVLIATTCRTLPTHCGRKKFCFELSRFARESLE